MNDAGTYRADDDRTATDDLDALVRLSHRIGAETRLVQPGGGNTSVKLSVAGAGDVAVDTLFVKGSGTDLRSIDRSGFSRLSLARLAALATVESMSDAEMMKFMASCMLAEGPAPSVETPVHSLLPHRVIVHTHDIATMSLTNISDAEAERIVTELFAGRIVYVPYARPGFPLARMVSALADSIPAAAHGLTLAHHGLVVFGDSVEECQERLLDAVARMEDYIATARRGRLRVGAARALRPPAERRAVATAILPAIRGALGRPDRVILHFDDSDSVLTALAGEQVPELVRRGMATPEHVLRAGRLPVWLELDPGQAEAELADDARRQLTGQRAEYEAYHRRNAPAGERPLDDWAKVVLVPGVGMITAFHDKKNAITANICYRAGLEAMLNAEFIDRFTFVSEREVFEFEHWPLERRKVDEQIVKDRETKLLPRRIVVVIGGASGIGREAAGRYAAEGAHVVVADLDGAAADAVAGPLAEQFSARVIAAAVDVRDDGSIDALLQRTVLEFGGIDHLFYTAGRPPRFVPVTELSRADLQAQLEVHYLGAVQTIARAARIMRAQGLGGSIVASVSKAAVAPGTGALAYGGSKAALLQALRVAAVELGADGIRVNAINADQIDTPLFLEFARERARSRGVTLEEQLESYRQRNLLGVSLIPPHAVAQLAVLLASDHFQYTTGDIITIDGGLPDAFPR